MAEIGTASSEDSLQTKQRSPGPDALEAAPLRVLLLSDGRPGHYRQSEGVAAALGRDRTVALARLEIGTRLPLPKGLIPKLGRVLPPGAFLGLVHGIAAARLETSDLVVSAGGATLGANVALARLWGVPNVFSGSTRGYPLDAFRLVLTPYASVGGTAPNVVAGPKPTPFDPDLLPPPRPIGAIEEMRGAHVGVLVGGPTPQAAFEAADWACLAALVEGLVTQWNCRATVVTSPRTPDGAYERLAPLATRLAGAMTLVDFRTRGAGSVDDALGCDVVLITSDSMSMMTEAALSQRPAVALMPETVRPSRDDEAVAGLVAARWLAVLPLAGVDAERLAAAAIALAPMRENHLDRLAATLRAAM